MPSPAYTYDPTALASSASHRVRRVIGDVGVDGVVSSSTCKFSDEEIAFAITDAGSETAAAIELLEQLATLYADKATVSAGNQKIELGKISASYAERARRLLERSGDGNAIVDMATTKVDGYSDDIDSDDVRTAGAAILDDEWWDV
jgi:hypothetical protein